MKKPGQEHQVPAEARPAGVLAAKLDRLTFAALAVACAAGIGLWIYQQHDNARLRAELARATEQAHPVATIAAVPRSSPPPAKSAADQLASGNAHAAATDALPMLGSAEVEPTLLRIIRDHLFVPGPQAMQLIRRIASADMPRAFDIVDRNTVGAARFRLRDELLIAWAKEDAAAAARAADSFPMRDRQMARQRVASIWSQTDPESAARYCPDSSALGSWAMRAPAKAAEFAETLSNPQNAVGHVAFLWALKDPDAAWMWASALPDACRYTGVEGVITGIVRTDPRKAVACLASEPTTAPYDKLPRLIAVEWARADPTAAAQWASALPASDGRAGALEAVVQGWTLRDTASAAAWLENVPSTWPERDALLQQFALHALSYAPELAAQAAAEIQAESKRDSEVERIASYWLHLDPSRARAWLSGVSLSPAARQQLHLEGFRNLPGDPVGGS